MPKTNIKVKLVGLDGNAIAIISRVSKALKNGGCENHFIKEFQKEAMSGDYDHVLQTCMDYVEVT